MKLRVEELSVTISNKRIIENISLSVDRYPFVGLLGPNGSGKSTLLRSIYRVLKPSGGRIYFGETPSQDIGNKELFKKVAVVGQFNTMNFDFSVMEMVMMGRIPHLGMLQAESERDYRIGEEALEKVGMREHRHRKYSSLSGGEKQRVILARAIVQEPRLLILDEPTNHLDVYYQLQLLSIIKELKIHTIAALHDLSLASQFCDYFYIMKKGNICYQGTPEQVLTKKMVKDVYGLECEIFKAGGKSSYMIHYELPMTTK
ncbi:MAG: ABC transporter ATP-binding protein [Lachnospiraceae bacterium]